MACFRTNECRQDVEYKMTVYRMSVDKVTGDKMSWRHDLDPLFVYLIPNSPFPLNELIRSFFEMAKSETESSKLFGPKLVTIFIKLPCFVTVHIFKN
jgi:hypothetical protein